MIATQTGSQFGETVQKCKHFDGELYQTCKELLPAGRDFYEDTDLFNAAELRKKEKLNLYRLVNLRISSFSFFQLLLLLLSFFD